MGGKQTPLRGQAAWAGLHLYGASIGAPLLRHPFLKPPPIPTMLCPECGSNVVSTASALICDGCGLVVEEKRLDLGAEWRIYEGRDLLVKPRTHTPPPPGFPVPATVIEVSDVRKLAGKRKSEGEMLRRTNRYNTGIATSMLRSLKAVSHLAAKLKVPEYVAEDARRLMSQARKAGITRGSSVEASAAACLMAAARLSGSPISQVEVARAADPEKVKPAMRIYRRLISSMGLRVAPPDPAVLVPRIVSSLGLPYDVEKKAVQILRMVGSSSRSPNALAGAAVFIAARDLYSNGIGPLRVPGAGTIRKKSFADAACVTTGSLRAVAKYIDGKLASRKVAKLFPEPPSPPLIPPPRRRKRSVSATVQA